MYASLLRGVTAICWLVLLLLLHSALCTGQCSFWCSGEQQNTLLHCEQHWLVALPHTAHWNFFSTFVLFALGLFILYKSLALIPVVSHLRVHLQRQQQLTLKRVLHTLLHDLECPPAALLRPLDDQLVVDLQYQLPPQLPQLFVLIQLHHRCYHDVSCPSLNRSVNGCSQSMHVVRILFFSFEIFTGIPLPTQQCFGVVFFLGDLLDSLLPELDFFSLAEPRVDSFLGFFEGAIPIFGEATGGFAVGNGEVHSFGLLPFGGVDILDEGYFGFSLRLVPLEEDLAVVDGLFDLGVHGDGSAGVEVASLEEGVDHGLAGGHVSEDPELELAVVGDDDLVALLRAEGLSDLIPVLVECGLVEEVGVPAGDSARLGVDVQAGVDSILLVDEVKEGVDEGAQQGLDLAVLHQGLQGLLRLDTPLTREVLEDVSVGISAAQGLEHGHIRAGQPPRCIHFWLDAQSFDFHFSILERRFPVGLNHSLLVLDLELLDLGQLVHFLPHRLLAAVGEVARVVLERGVFVLSPLRLLLARGEQELLHLLLAAHVELRHVVLLRGLHPRQELLFQGPHVVLRLRLDALHVRDVHLHALPLHVRQHFSERPPVVVVDVAHRLHPELVPLPVRPHEVPLQQRVEQEVHEERHLRVQRRVLDPLRQVLTQRVHLNYRRVYLHRALRTILQLLERPEQIRQVRLRVLLHQMLPEHTQTLPLPLVRRHLLFHDLAFQLLQLLRKVIAQCRQPVLIRAFRGVLQSRHMHRIGCEPLHVDPVVVEHRPIEAVVVPDLQPTPVLQVRLEHLYQIRVLGEVVDEQPRPVPEVHLRTTKTTSADDLPLPVHRFRLQVDIDRLRIPRVRSVRVLDQSIQRSLRIALAPHDGNAWDGIYGVDGFVVERSVFVVEGVCGRA